MVSYPTVGFCEEMKAEVYDSAILVTSRWSIFIIL